MQRHLVLGLIVLWLLPTAPLGLAADDGFILVQSTTSTQNSGLFDHILPKFTQITGIEVRVVAVGTGQALKNARNGDGDVVLVHSKADEEKFVADGWGLKRHDVMYNDFAIVGPASDPAGIAGLKDADQALKKIAKVEAPFASRGDNSGTHKAELRLWKKTKVDPTKASGDWYLETGSGMGATLNTAVGKHAYTLTDRGTWLGFANKRDFKVLVEGDSQLFNQYGVTLVNPAKHPRVRTEKGQAFVDWLTGVEGQKAISNFKIDGQQLFTPNARPGS
ncbi:substrate-binding domain-containing protein [Methyloceanibacter sp.]|uniref:substrate-binding domain-containing protein n=1 Tax=Methyloceanibacter sp. TaxID=1965321 RepID=UPI003C759892